MDAGCRGEVCARACRSTLARAQWISIHLPDAEVPIEPERIAEALAKAALDKKATDVVILDMHELVDYTDLFVICSARNRRQVQAIADEVRRVAKHELGVSCVGAEGLQAARWVLVDFGSVVVHVFDEPLRGFYNLDGLWSDAPRLPTPEASEADEGAESVWSPSPG